MNVSLCLHVANDNLSNMEIEVTAAQLRIGFFMFLVRFIRACGKGVRLNNMSL